MNYSRQLDFLPPEKLAFPIVVIGAGAIGSAVVINLAKMGCSNITVWDKDILEEVNVPNQICQVNMVGNPKVVALDGLVYSLTSTAITPVHEEYKGQVLQGVVISAVDSMEVRSLIWKSVKMKFGVPLFIDGRMGLEFARLYSLRPTDADASAFYESTLYSDENAERLPCSARSIIYCPTVIGGIIVNMIGRYARGEPIWKEVLVDLNKLEIIKT